MIQVREDREIDDAQRAVTFSGRLPADEVLPDTRGHHHAAGAQPHPDGFAQRRQEICQPGLTHPVAQVQSVATIHQQDVCLFYPSDPAFFVDAGQRGKLEHAQRLPAQLAHRGRGSPGDETPCSTRTALRVAVPSSRDTQSVGLGNRFAEEDDQCVVDARVLDASGREKELHDAFPGDSYSRSSITTFGLPPTAWASAAAMKGSMSPSRTSSGLRLSTPVRRSFTS